MDNSNQLDLSELYKIAAETWRFQVQSYWTRNTYFAAFEIAALGGVWTVSKEHHWTAGAAAIAAILLSIIWFLSSDRQHEYITFWWSKLIELERQLTKGVGGQGTVLGGSAVEPILLASDFNRWRMSRPHRRPRLMYHYSTLVQCVPFIFIALWLYLIAYNLHAL